MWLIPIWLGIGALLGAAWALFALGVWWHDWRVRQRARSIARWRGPATMVYMVAGPPTPHHVQIPKRRPTAADATTYWISSTTLAAVYAHLTRRLPAEAAQEPEWMLAATGLRLPNGDRTLEQLIEIRLARQSGAAAAFDMQDFVRTALVLYDHGQALQAIFHSHRFAGPPVPSGTDWRLADVLEDAYPVIQAVFSEDGYVRFFGWRSFAIKIFGKGAEAIGDDSKLWRITERGTLADPRLGQ